MAVERDVVIRLALQLANASLGKIDTSETKASIQEVEKLAAVAASSNSSAIQQTVKSARRAMQASAEDLSQHIGKAITVASEKASKVVIDDIREDIEDVAKAAAEVSSNAAPQVFGASDSASNNRLAEMKSLITTISQLRKEQTSLSIEAERNARAYDLSTEAQIAFGVALANTAGLVDRIQGSNKDLQSTIEDVATEVTNLRQNMVLARKANMELAEEQQEVNDELKKATVEYNTLATAQKNQEKAAQAGIQIGNDSIGMLDRQHVAANQLINASIRLAQATTVLIGVNSESLETIVKTVAVSTAAGAAFKALAVIRAENAAAAAAQIAAQAGVSVAAQAEAAAQARVNAMLTAQIALRTALRLLMNPYVVLISAIVGILAYLTISENRAREAERKRAEELAKQREEALRAYQREQEAVRRLDQAYAGLQSRRDAIGFNSGSTTPAKVIEEARAQFEAAQAQISSQFGVNGDAAAQAVENIRAATQDSLQAQERILQAQEAEKNALQDKFDLQREGLNQRKQELDVAKQLLEAEQRQRQSAEARIGLLSSGDQAFLKSIDDKIGRGDQLSRNEIRRAQRLLPSDALTAQAANFGRETANDLENLLPRQRNQQDRQALSDAGLDPNGEAGQLLRQAKDANRRIEQELVDLIRSNTEKDETIAEEINQTKLRIVNIETQLQQQKAAVPQ